MAGLLRTVVAVRPTPAARRPAGLDAFENLKPPKARGNFLKNAALAFKAPLRRARAARSSAGHLSAAADGTPTHGRACSVASIGAGWTAPGVPGAHRCDGADALGTSPLVACGVYHDAMATAGPAGDAGCGPRCDANTRRISRSPALRVVSSPRGFCIASRTVRRPRLRALLPIRVTLDTYYPPGKAPRISRGQRAGFVSLLVPTISCCWPSPTLSTRTCVLRSTGPGSGSGGMSAGCGAICPGAQ